MSHRSRVNPWDALESIRRLVALPEVWEAKLGEHFAAFKILCLEESSRLALSLPCPRGCGCLHTVIMRHDHTGALAICRCDPPACSDIPVTLAQITPLEVNRGRLARAVGQALGCQTKVTHLKLPETLQFGSWPAESVPGILTMQSEPSVFRSVIAELVARLRRPFIVFAPTSDHLNAECLELLANVQASFFALDSTLTLTAHGSLLSKRSLGELLAGLAPVAENSRPAPPRPRYALRKGLGIWHLNFDGEEAGLKHQRAIFYVGYLLINPPVHPMHALDLLGKIPEMYRQQLGLPEIADPETGKLVCLESHARLQERNLSLDHAQGIRNLVRKEKQLEAILDSTDASEPVKAEALRELEEIFEFRRHDSGGSIKGAQTAANTVRRAIHRFQHSLRCALDAQGNPHPVLSRFAAYIEDYILIPSARYSGHGGPHARTGLAGCFTHEPPENVRWK